MGPNVDDILNRFDELSFEDIIGALQLAVDFLRGLDGSDGGGAVATVLDTKLPLVDRSVSDLIDLASEWADVIDEIAADPVGSIQKLGDVLSDRFGLP